MNTQRKAPVTALAGFPCSGKAALLSQILTEERGTGRVHGPGQGYIRCERAHRGGRSRAQVENALGKSLPFSP